jgi:hypothetical protein
MQQRTMVPWVYTVIGEALFISYPSYLQEQAYGYNVECKGNRTMMRSMDIDSNFEFGKHKGKPLREVAEKHGSYIAWLCDNEVVMFDEECLDWFVELEII